MHSQTADRARGFLCYPGIHTCSTTPLCSEHLQDKRSLQGKESLFGIQSLQDESARITLEEWNVGFWCSLQKPVTKYDCDTF